LHEVSFVTQLGLSFLNYFVTVKTFDC
jgi:hypothetical protein